MNALVLSDTPLARHAPLALWRVAEAFMHLLYNLFGAPEDVAAKHTLTRAPHALIASWLRAGEKLLRRLLLVEASAFAKPNTRPILWPKRQRVRRLMGFDAAHPEAWRVSFRCFAGDTHARHAARHESRGAARACVSPARSARFPSAWPLAERYEALLRVFNDPVAYARRLARRLYATPHRLREMLRAPPETEHRIEDFAQLSAAAEAAAAVFNSS